MNSWRDFSNDRWAKREAGDEEAMAFADTSSADLKSLWNRTRPRRQSSVLLEVYRCDAERLLPQIHAIQDDATFRRGAV